MNLDESVWDATVFTKNRNRLLEGDVAREFLSEVVQQAQAKGLTSDEHFTVDGTLIEAWASLKSFQPKDQKKDPPDDPGNPTVDFHGEKRSNQSHESTTDPDALSARKGRGKEAKLSYNGNRLTENRNGLIVNTEVLQAHGTAERDAALVMLEQIPGGHRVTVGTDKGYDTKDFVAECRNVYATPHVAQNTTRGGSAIDTRTTRHDGYAISRGCGNDGADATPSPSFARSVGAGAFRRQRNAPNCGAWPLTLFAVALRSGAVRVAPPGHRAVERRRYCRAVAIVVSGVDSGAFRRQRNTEKCGELGQQRRLASRHPAPPCHCAGRMPCFCQG